MSKFNEIYDKYSKENAEASKGKKHPGVGFSKKKEAVFTQSLLNTNDYKQTVVKTKNGEFIDEEITPVADFRKQFIGGVLSKYGVDKQICNDANENYEFTEKQASAFNNLARESIEQFMRAGFTYDFNKKKDFAGSIKLNNIDDRVITSRVPGTDVSIKTHEFPHKVLVKKSGTPKWCKEKHEDD